MRHRDRPPTDDLDDHDRGLSFDLATLLDRRRALTLLGGAGLVGLVGCGRGGRSGTDGTAADATSTTATGGPTTAGATETTTASDGSCSVIPEETAGPYPADGSNGPDVLTESGVVRRDITSSFGSM